MMHISPEPTNDTSNEDVFHENVTTNVSSFGSYRDVQNSRRVTVTMPDVEEPSTPVQLPVLPAGWDERQVSASRQVPI